jgi:hypothetical protein
MDMGMETGTHDCEQSLLKRVAVSLRCFPSPPRHRWMLWVPSTGDWAETDGLGADAHGGTAGRAWLGGLGAWDPWPD